MLWFSFPEHFGEKAFFLFFCWRDRLDRFGPESFRRQAAAGVPFLSFPVGAALRLFQKMLQFRYGMNAAGQTCCQSLYLFFFERRAGSRRTENFVYKGLEIFLNFTGSGFILHRQI